MDQQNKVNVKLFMFEHFFN